MSGQPFDQATVVFRGDGKMVSADAVKDEDGQSAAFRRQLRETDLFRGVVPAFAG